MDTYSFSVPDTSGFLMSPDPQQEEIFLRFCGNREPHSQHTFWMNFSIYDGGRYHNCLGYMVWQL
jgi:hypothetical protein